jgi:hypothetical protein
MSDNKTEQTVEEQPKKKMTAGNIVLLIFSIILILGGSYYLYKSFTSSPNVQVRAGTGNNLARGVLDAAGTAQDIDIMRGFSYYF